MAETNKAFQLLPTILVRAINGAVLRLLLDTGSNVDLLTYAAAVNVNLFSQAHTIQHDSIVLNTVSNQTHISEKPIYLKLEHDKGTLIIKFRLIPDIHPLHGGDVNVNMINSSLSDPFPRQWPLQVHGIISAKTIMQIADPLFIPYKHIPGLYLWNTLFGKAIFGQPQHQNLWQTPIRSSYLTATERLSLITERFMQLQSLPEDNRDQRYTVQELRAIRLLQETLTYSEVTKRFTCKLLFKENPIIVNNYKNAAARLHRVWEILVKNKEMRDAYVAAINKLIEEDRVVEIVDPEAHSEDNKVTYLPHSIVHSPASLTTPYRVVYDGSATLQSKPTKVTFNDNLLQGVALHQNLQALLIRFRKRKFVLNGDIKALFLQVLLHESHQDFCRFLWKTDRYAPIKVYKFKVLLFGLNCSPTIAMAAVQRLTKMVLEDPTSSDHDILAARRLMEDIYVDDLVTTFDTRQDLINCYNSINKILSKGSFNMRKFLSNDMVFLRTVPKENRLPGLIEDDPVQIEIADPTVRAFQEPEQNNPDQDLVVLPRKNVVSLCNDAQEDLHSTFADTTTLGYRYNVRDDLIVYDQYDKLHEVEEDPSMRTLASKVAKIFDPLGFLSGFILYARNLLRQCHEEKFSWTTKIPKDSQLFRDFHVWLRNTKKLHKITFPRYAPYNDTSIFAICADACKTGIACTVHAITAVDGTVVSNLLFVQSRIVNTDLQKRVMAALELTALDRAATLGLFLVNHLHISKSQIVLNTDSMVTAQWLRHDSHNLAPFVAARVKRIQESGFIVRHIEGPLNPSDIYSRGTSDPLKLMTSLTLHGPKYFTDPRDTWPVSKADRVSDNDEDYTVGLRRQNVIVHANYISTTPLEKLVRFGKRQVLYTLTDYHSSWLDLIRSVASVYTALHIWVSAIKSKHTSTKKQIWPTRLSQEFKALAARLLIKQTQELYFADEINILLKKQKLKSTNFVAKHGGFLDTDGVLRAAGRVVFDDIMNAERMPIILPASKLALLLIKHIHVSNFHATKNAIRQLLLEKYVLRNSESLLKTVIKACVLCQRFNAHRVIEKMGPTPKFIQAAQTEEPRENLAFQFVAADFTSGLKIRRFEFQNPDVGKNQTPFNVLKKPKKRRGRPTKAEQAEEARKKKAEEDEKCSTVYVIVYVCLYSRAIHLELVLNETQFETCRALVRLFASRGVPKILVTDSAPNFIESTKQVNRHSTFWSDVLGHLDDKFHIDHKTYVGEAGGSNQSPAESFVRLVKLSILKSFRNRILTFQEMYTSLKEIEMAHNSRPISSISAENQIGLQPIQMVLNKRYQPLADLMPVDFTDKKDYQLRWKHLNAISKEYHKVWRKLYWPLVQQITKWSNSSNKVLEPGTVVLVFEPSLKPYFYRMGVVAEVDIGRDGIIRNLYVTFGKSKEQIKRTVRSVIPLNLDLFSEELKAIEQHINAKVQRTRQKMRMQPTKNGTNKNTDKK